VTWSVTATAQSHSETIKKTLKFEKQNSSNVLYVANINGSVKAVGYNGSEIQIEVVKKISAKSEERLEKAKELLGVGIIDRMDTIIVYVKGICAPFSNNRGNWNENSRWEYNYNDCEQSFDFKMDFIIKVPYSSNVYLSTINQGDVIAESIQGIVNAKNINGSIILDKIDRVTYAHTINGDLTINFNRHPSDKAYYYSLNGDIMANYSPGLSADLSFKSFNGDLFTNISKIEYLPHSVEVSKSDKGEGVNYKLEAKSLIRAGNGGVRLDFETFNGDVYIKEVSK